MNLNQIRSEVRARQPLIHCITNPISIHQCANGILSVGARPMMAEHPREVSEITSTAQALLLNLGSITDVRMESMLISAETARELDIPVVIDMVGISCSSLRREFAMTLLETARPAVIKGNYSEIRALYDCTYRSSGVDAENTLDPSYVSRTAASLSKQYGAVILASGKTDIVTDGRTLVHVSNGSPQLAAVTGTGCMLGALCGCYLAVDRTIDAAVCACVVLGISGETARTDKGSGTFMVNLMDSLSALTDETFEQHLSLEEIQLENT